MEELARESIQILTRLSGLREQSKKAGVLTIRPIIEEMAELQERLNLINHQVNFRGGK